MPAGLRFGGDDSAAFAGNWKTVLAVDLGMGLAVLLGGVAVLVATGRGWAWALVAIGAVYLFFAGGRATRWVRLRRRAADGGPAAGD